MADTPKTPAVSNITGLRGKPRPVPLMQEAMSESELHDEAMRYAMTASQQLRKEKDEWREKAESVTAEYVAFRQDAAQEILTAQHEYDTKSSMMRTKIELLDKQLQDMTRRYEIQITDLQRKLDHFERATAELSTKCDDMEKFYVHELRTIRDTTNHMVIGQIGGINNATSALNDTAKHLGEGLVKQVENSANNMSSFIDDIRKRRAAGEYLPNPDRLHEKMQPLAPEAEEALAELVKNLKAKEPDV
jgi:hypothetical protein